MSGVLLLMFECNVVLNLYRTSLMALFTEMLMVGIKIKFTYCSCSMYGCITTMVHFKNVPDLRLVNRNYATHCSVITLIHYAL